MSVRVMGMVFETNLETADKLLLLALADHANEEGRHIYPSVARMAAKCSMSERTVQYHLRALVGRGLLVVVDHAEGGRGHAVDYRIDLDVLKGCMSCTLSPVKGATDDEKGCKPAQERVQPVAPQPSVEPSKNRQRSNGLAFERFWTLYPKKRHKPAAVRAWAKNGCEAIAAEVCAGVERWLASENWTDGFIEDASTFLNQRQWEDAVPPPRNGHDRDYDHNRSAVNQWLEQKRREDARQGRTDG